ncbi:hypothetical protein DER29_4324 [Micromonospora sp. M71_S20]|uniref:hypothetical protein n=1 Tax=Micromonospora sp. M71_S20 TaxID=592872 RepID=UPI000EAD5DB5|nr:hypothetical protein [Micromonospora sp. M71_S20]RLK13307.1 hypothetical protein DER29_4324 [Micromonospora sp. M71_S20]
MTSPHHLHAVAAAWSLQAARHHLHHLADEEAQQIAAEQLEAPALLQSPAWGRRHALGGHGDPTPGMVVIATDPRPARRNRWAEMHGRLDRKLTWLANAVFASPPHADALDRLQSCIPDLQPGTAALVHRHLADEDQWVRDALGIDPARALLPGNPECPACGARALEVQTAGPVDAWTVVCAGTRQPGGGPHNPCLCTGQGCPCGMPSAVEGVAHIWPRGVVLGGVAGAAPQQAS